MTRPSSFALAGVIAALLLPASAFAQRAPALAEVDTYVAKPGTPMPRFKVDAAWPQLPPDTIMGQVGGVDVDPKGNVWLVQRPGTLSDLETGLAKSPPEALCCKPLPPVIEFSQAGKYLQGWGGQDQAPTLDGVNQWPASMHGMFVAQDGTLWFGGNGDGDHVILNYTTDGKYLRQIGRRMQSRGNLDHTALGNPADVNVEDGEVMIADGYINERVIDFDAKTLDFKWISGAYGAQPPGPKTPGVYDMSRQARVAKEGAGVADKTYGNVVHCVVKTRDHDLYVCDRLNNRAQLFHEEADGKLTFKRDIVISPKSQGQGAVTDVAFSPDQKYLYIADMADGRIWILLRSTSEVLGSIGRIGHSAGEFTVLHNLTTDAQGNLYATEVQGQRVQKFVFTGVK